VSGRRLLWVDVKLPTPDRDSASLRAVQILQALAQLGFSVDFAALAAGPSPADPGIVARHGARLVADADEAAILQHVAAHGEDYAVVMLSWTRVARRLLEPVRRAARRAFIVFDTVDLNFVREFRHARLTGNAAILRRAVQMKWDEVRLSAAADRTFVVTPVDRDTLQAASPTARIAVVGQVAEPVGAVPGPERRAEDLVFLGHFQAAPNADAGRFLIAEILPLVRRSRPAARAVLIGSDPDPGLLAMASPVVRFTGHLPTLDAAFAAGKVFVAPLRFGSGIKGKLLTALAHGLPIVASDLATEGMGLRPGIDYLAADGAESFAAAIVRILDDRVLWQSLSDAGRRAAERYSRPVLEAQLQGALPLELPARFA
jgi:hypothetical protein